ncbi:MAG: hypothetical protein WA445_09415 [Pseudolabrys sp.]
MIELQRPAKLRFGPFNKSEDEQRAFFHAALERAQEAETKAGTIERCFAVAGFLFNVKFAGNAGDAEQRSGRPHDLWRTTCQGLHGHSTRLAGTGE